MAAQLAWGPEPLEGRVKSLVSIGTGLPPPEAFNIDVVNIDVVNIGKTLAALTSETEVRAERFQRERGLLDSTGPYRRFNVTQGLEGSGLEEAKKFQEMAAATRRYMNSHEVQQQIQACTGRITDRKYYENLNTDDDERAVLACPIEPLARACGWQPNGPRFLSELEAGTPLVEPHAGYLAGEQ